MFKDHRKWKTRVAVVLAMALLGALLALSQPAATTAYNMDNLIRLHVVANSDNPADQEVKQEIRRRLMEELGPLLEKTRGYREAYGVIESNLDRVERLAGEVLRENGFEYPVRAEIGRDLFPTKSYGEFVLPAGEYTALRVTVGDGYGRNWWCVLYPPVCFTYGEGSGEILPEHIAAGGEGMIVIPEADSEKRLLLAEWFKKKIWDLKIAWLAE